MEAPRPSRAGGARVILSAAGGAGCGLVSDPPLPAPYLRFLDLYGEGRYWDSHEALEDAWRETRSAFYQGLILYASAFVHLGRENAHGVRAQLRKAAERLAPYPAAYMGLDVERIRRHCEDVRAAVAGEPAGWTEAVVPLELAPSPERVRGDEPELGGGGGLPQ